MPITDPHLATIASWVGKTYAEMEALFPRKGGAFLVQWQAGMRGCWNLVRAAYSLRGVEIPEEYHAALDARLFRTVFEPEPWDVVPVCNHRLAIVTHVALVLPDSMILHALEEYGVVAQPINREPWWSRIARDDKGRRGYLRLRETIRPGNLTSARTRTEQCADWLLSPHPPRAARRRLSSRYQKAPHLP